MSDIAMNYFERLQQAIEDRDTARAFFDHAKTEAEVDLAISELNNAQARLDFILRDARGAKACADAIASPFLADRFPNHAHGQEPTAGSSSRQRRWLTSAKSLTEPVQRFVAPWLEKLRSR